MRTTGVHPKTCSRPIAAHEDARPAFEEQVSGIRNGGRASPRAGFWLGSNLRAVCGVVTAALILAGPARAESYFEGVRTDFLNWSAPDGSSVFCFMMNHDADYIDWRPGTPRIANDPQRMTKWITEQETEYKGTEDPAGPTPPDLQGLCGSARPS
jgi:hypothetical protein